MLSVDLCDVFCGAQAINMKKSKRKRSVDDEPHEQRGAASAAASSAPSVEEEAKMVDELHNLGYPKSMCEEALKVAREHEKLGTADTFTIALWLLGQTDNLDETDSGGNSSSTSLFLLVTRIIQYTTAKAN